MTNLTDMIKERLGDYIYDAIGGTVSTDWNIRVTAADSMPISTIKFEPIRWRDEVYGMKMSSTQDGSLVDITFSIFLYNKIERDYEDRFSIDSELMDYADTIIDYFIDKSGDSSEKTTYKINRIYNIGCDEITIKSSDRSRAVNGIIITGIIEAVWDD